MTGMSDEQTIVDAVGRLSATAAELDPPAPRYHPVRTEVLEALVTEHVAQTALLRKLCAHLGVDTGDVLL